MNDRINLENQSIEKVNAFSERKELWNSLVNDAPVEQTAKKGFLSAIASARYKPSTEPVYEKDARVDTCRAIVSAIVIFLESAAPAVLKQDDNEKGRSSRGGSLTKSLTDSESLLLALFQQIRNDAWAWVEETSEKLDN